MRRDPSLLALFSAIAVMPAWLAAQQMSAEEAEQRADAVATRRAERIAERAERMPSRPFVLREPVPLPVDQMRPPGGEPAGKSCPPSESCTIDYSVPGGRILVVTAVWSAAESRCDHATLGASPATGEAITPWWNCSHTLQVTGKGAGFSGFLFAPPDVE